MTKKKPGRTTVLQIVSTAGILILGALGAGIGFAGSASAAPNACQCIVSAGDEAGKTTATKVVGGFAAGQFPDTSDSSQALCTQSCAAASNDTAMKPTITNNACNSNTPTGATLKVFAAVQSRAFTFVKNYGTLVNTPAQYSCICPPGYSLHLGVQTGTGTPVGKCSKEVGSISESPTGIQQIGTWGFVLNGKVYKYGANATCTKSSEKLCQLQ